MNRRGMTLMEILLALFLFGVLATFVVQVMDSVLNLWSAGERRGRGDLVFASTVERFRGDLRALHTGQQGWMVLDTYSVASGVEGQPDRHLPRLRFLADGAALADADPSGRAPVEVMWALVPEMGDPRFGRLTRYVHIPTPSSTLLDNATSDAMLRSDGGLVVMDGLLWTEMAVVDERGARQTRFRLDAHNPFDFPSEVNLVVESVTGNARKKPPLLDTAILADGAQVAMRGVAPVEMPEFAMIEREWVGVSGRFPSLSFMARGQRGSLPAPHDGRTPVYFPMRYESQNAVAAAGRRTL
ncbi:MAG: PulJ/GspJ family protein [Planctomycetota bacterium]